MSAVLPNRPAAVTYQPGLFGIPDLGMPNRLRRVSLRAVVAAVIVALSLQMLFSVLGLAAGAWAFNPTTDDRPFAGFPAVAGIWWIVTGTISMLIGGWVAGRLASVPNRLDGSLHGAVVWGLVTLISFYMLTSTAGALVSGTAYAIGQGVSAVGSGVSQGVAAAIPDRQQPANQQGNQAQAAPAFDVNALTEQLRETLRETENPELQPERLESRLNDLAATAQDALKVAATNPQSADQQVDRVLQTFYKNYDEVKGSVNQDAVVNVLTKNTDMSEQEARQAVDRWQNQYEQTSAEFDRQMAQAEQELNETYDQAKQKTAEVAEDVADAVSTAALWGFFVMMLGLIASIGGGFLGTPEHAVQDSIEEDEASHDPPRRDTRKS